MGWGDIRGLKKSKDTDKVLDTCPNWEVFTKMENSFARAPIRPSLSIFPETLKHLSSALGPAVLPRRSGPARGRLAGSWHRSSSLGKLKRGRGLPTWGCPLTAGLTSTFNNFYCHFRKKGPHFHCKTDFSKFPHFSE